MKRKGIEMTLEQVIAHQRKHGFEAPAPFSSETVRIAEKKLRKLRIGRRKMTQTELEFQALLSAQKEQGMILDFKFEGVRLPWGDGMLFKSDFAVQQLNGAIALIEVKGKHIWKHAIVRFKGCRAEWKDWFCFEFWQKDSNGLWHQLA